MQSKEFHHISWREICSCFLLLPPCCCCPMLIAIFSPLNLSISFVLYRRLLVLSCYDGESSWQHSQHLVLSACLTQLVDSNASTWNSFSREKTLFLFPARICISFRSFLWETAYHALAGNRLELNSPTVNLLFVEGYIVARSFVILFNLKRIELSSVLFFNSLSFLFI